MSEIENIRAIVREGIEGLAKDVEEYRHASGKYLEGFDLIRQGFDKLHAGRGFLRTALESSLRNYSAISQAVIGSTALKEPMEQLFDFLGAMAKQEEATTGLLDYRNEILEDEVADNTHEMTQHAEAAENAVRRLDEASKNL